jgi:hypothetical protein
LCGDRETIGDLLQADVGPLLRKGWMLTQSVDEKLPLPVD